MKELFDEKYVYYCEIKIFCFSPCSFPCHFKDGEDHTNYDYIEAGDDKRIELYDFDCETEKGDIKLTYLQDVLPERDKERIDGKGSRGQSGFLTYYFCRKSFLSISSICTSITILKRTKTITKMNF